MTARLPGGLRVARDTWATWRRPAVASAAAALAYRFLFALAPLSVVALVVAGRVLGETAAEARLRDAVERAAGMPLPEPVWEAVAALWAGIADPGGGLAPSLIALLVVLVGASNLFAELGRSLNLVWDAPRRPFHRRLATQVAGRAFGLLLVLAAGGLMVVSVGMSTLARALAPGILAWGPAVSLGRPMQQLGLFVGLAVSLTLLFRALPGRRPSWRAAASGALLATGLFSVGRVLVAWYLARIGAGSAFGAAGALIVVLLWAHYTARFLLLGAALTGALEGWRPAPEERPSGRSAPATPPELGAADDLVGRPRHTRRSRWRPHR